MERKTIETLRAMVCGELEDIAKKGIVTHESLDILKDLLQSAKDLEKIEHYQKEREKEWAMDYDRGYSQRKYYIDADYDPHMSYGNSYAQGGHLYTPHYQAPMDRGYSRHGNTKAEVVEELRQMMGEAKDDTVKSAISDAIMKLSK